MPLLSLSDLTSAEAVQAALDEYAKIGQKRFLEKYKFGRSRDYVVRNPATGEWADSKAIVGVALAYQFPDADPLLPQDFSGGEATVVAKLRSLGFELFRIDDIVGQDWSEHEVELIVADYLAMLVNELAAQKYNKSAHRRQLLSNLPGRTSQSVEFKHANISAALIELGFPYLKGYQPRSNFQRSALLPCLVRQVSRHASLDEVAMSAVQRPTAPVEHVDFRVVHVKAPKRELSARRPESVYRVPVPVRRDYIEREARNRSLGLAGEEFALDFERWRLANLGAPQLAERVEHVSRTKGDGLGYDIQSYDLDGRDRFIEVKTTSFGDRTPFFVSSNEVEFARHHSGQFSLYRLFDFRSAPRLFELAGPIEHHCDLDATTYRASFA